MENNKEVGSEEWLNSSPSRREIGDMLAAYNKQTMDSIHEVQGVLAPHTLMIETFRRLLIKAGIFTEEQLKDALQELYSSIEEKQKSKCAIDPEDRK